MNRKNQGIHFISNFNDCKCVESIFVDSDLVRGWLRNIVKDSGLNIVGDCFYSFGKKCGFTGVVILAESHCSIHTWPELKKVDCDVYVCNVTQDNTAKAEYIYLALKSLYQPDHEDFYKVER